MPVVIVTQDVSGVFSGQKNNYVRAATERPDTANRVRRNADTSQHSAQPDRTESGPTNKTQIRLNKTQLKAEQTGFVSLWKMDIHHFLCIHYCVFPTSCGSLIPVIHDIYDIHCLSKVQYVNLLKLLTWEPLI